MCFLTQKIGIIRCQFVQHCSDHIRITAREDLIHIGFEILKPLSSQRMRQTAYDQLLLLTQINPIMLLDIYIETLEILISQCQHLNHPISFNIALWPEPDSPQT